MRSIRAIFSSGTVGLLLVAAAFAADTPMPVTRVERIIQEYTGDDEFMGAVLVARGDQVLFSRSYGSANLELGVANSPDTRFRIGSLTKQFTAAAILLLEERGKLSTGDPVKKFHAEAPGAWDRITLAHLLTHTSGIPNFTTFPDYASFSLAPTTPADNVAHFRDKPLDFEPGTKFRYSNSGYIVLGLIVEKASGVPYEKFLADEILEPLGLKDSGYDSNAMILPNRAAGYSPSPQGRRNAPYENMSVAYAAGAMYSTVGDLHRWNQALWGGKLLTAASLEKMQTAPSLPDGIPSSYAFGIGVNQRAVGKVIEHSGGVEGFNSKLAYYPSDGMTVVALANLSTPTADLIVNKIGSVARGEAVVLPSERVAIRLPAKTLREYLGTYELRPNFDLEIVVDGDHLAVIPARQRPDPLFAEKKDWFFSRRFDVLIEFKRDERGRVTHLLLDRGNGRTEAKRK
jgi:CubicO group peptidase (beta-lactamase class C family)